MSWRLLRPVGEPLCRVAEQAVPWPAGYHAFFVQSGTAALALSLLLLRGRAAERRRVLLPAYGCPDLVAAVVYAGLEPELIDLLPGEPFMSVDHLARRLDETVLAILGVHFLGLPERIAALRELAGRQGAVVIEDSAQRIPPAEDPASMADLVVVSFGRGKPAGALGGGALLVRESAYDAAEIEVLIGPPLAPAMPPALQRAAYNFLIRPRLYGVVARIPGLGLGETHYRPLTAIRTLDPARRAFASSQLADQAARGPSPLQGAMAEMLARCSGITLLPCCSSSGPVPRLLRYPLLCASKALRDDLHRALTAAGLGSSVMYGQTLADLPGMPPCRSSELHQARGFADRLLTLPVHSGVRPQDLSCIEQALAEKLSRC